MDDRDKGRGAPKQRDEKKPSNFTFQEGLYTEPLLYLEFFTPAVCISRKRNGIRQKTMLLQQNGILLLDNKQTT